MGAVVVKMQDEILVNASGQWTELGLYMRPGVGSILTFPSSLQT